jgi:hypothetical protein
MRLKVGQLNEVPHGILQVVINILCENVFQNPQISRKTGTVGAHLALLV